MARKDFQAVLVLAAGRQCSAAPLMPTGTISGAARLLRGMLLLRKISYASSAAAAAGFVPRAVTQSMSSEDTVTVTREKTMRRKGI